MCQSCEDSELFCLCRQPLGYNELYLGCEGCEGWYHPSCCGLSKEEATRFSGSNLEGDREHDKFFCPDCQKNQRAFTPASTDAASASPLQPLLSMDVDNNRSLLSQSRHAGTTRRKGPTVIVVPAPLENEYYYGPSIESVSALSSSALSRPSNGTIGSSSSSLPSHPSSSSSSSAGGETPLFVAPVRGSYKSKKSQIKTAQKVRKSGASTAEGKGCIFLSSSSSSSPSSLPLPSSSKKNKLSRMSSPVKKGEIAEAHKMPFKLVRVKGSTWPSWSEPANSFGSRGAEELKRVCGDVLAEMRFLDAHGTFAEPVPLDLVEGYAQAIPQPMDLSTMQAKVNAIQGDTEGADGDDANVSRCQRKKRKMVAAVAVRGYASIAEFRRDLRLVIENCLTWNVADSDFYNDAKSLDAAAHAAFLRASGQAAHSLSSISNKGGRQTKKARR